MKALITAADVKTTAENHQTILYVSEESIITPAANDAAKELGVEITVRSLSSPNQPSASSLDPALLAKIVEEVMVFLKQPQCPLPPHKEADPCGLRIVKGSHLILEDFNTGNPKDCIKIKELFNKKECSNYSVGIMTLEKTDYTSTTTKDEIDYIVEGTLECCVDNRCYTAQAGDTLYIPAHATITLSTSDKVKLLYVC
ncbi:ethanolamine utilization protein [Desulfitobacterium dehalogenans ATCC 51507]|uniref:Ethanolamine utilization protein n=1 Tax=Desulfitobacterium dehalogenans (strain ATCC 51507 / DSM 9161 / JW/IU-DC1) TaxID=756499 RepID=I4A4E1_DESDJ|nr:pyrimidine/purine nucleoside phosphorylase [Desulfitobacterium dehalogenans]AFL98825.1 ethanolamine utilization protein [Desulfitobacterium dehalogenans ATCC 51507]